MSQPTLGAWLFGVGLGLSGALAQAGTLLLTVTDKDGKPAPDVVVLVQTPGRAAPPPVATTSTIAQEGLKFQPFLTVVAVGSTLRFTNRDGYDHHVRAMPSGPLGAVPPAQSFELRLDALESAVRPSNNDYDFAQPQRRKSGVNTVDVKVDKSGPIGLGCHLHGSMRGQVYVSATPWFAKTDAAGVARVDGVPEGAVELMLWHPDQLSDQAPIKAQVAEVPATVGGQLNFVPRRRRN